MLTSEPLVQWSVGVVYNNQINNINILLVLDIRQWLQLRPRLQAKLRLGPGLGLGLVLGGGRGCLGGKWLQNAEGRRG